MIKITVHSVNNVRKAHELALILRDTYNHDVAIDVNDNYFNLISASNDRWDNLVISLEESEDNYTYIYFWEDGKDEMNIVGSIAKYVNVIPMPLSNDDYCVKELDALYFKVDLSKNTNLEDIAKGIHSYLG